APSSLVEPIAVATRQWVRDRGASRQAQGCYPRAMAETPTSVTEDRVLGGKVTLRQPAKGYRAGLDAALLAAAGDAAPSERVIDVGCGVGAVMLAAAMRRPGTNFLGVERDPTAAAL